MLQVFVEFCVARNEEKRKQLPKIKRRIKPRFWEIKKNLEQKHLKSCSKLLKSHWESTCKPFQGK